MLSCISLAAIAQPRQTIALVSIDTKELEINNATMASIVRLELEKIDRYEVLDRYDVHDAIIQNNIDPENCFGKNAVVNAGKLLGTDLMLTGSVERFGDKVTVIMRLINVQEERIEKTSVMEYIYAPNELQTMAMLSLNELLGIPNDPHIVDLLINYNLPITTAKTSLSLNGPRMGVVYMTGETSERMQASKDDGGFDMFPVSSMFGYQFEKQYLSAGNFQALVEVVAAVNGLESGTLIPSMAFLNGFRFNESGWEFGLGPVVRMVKTAKGYYNAEGKWILATDQPDQADQPEMHYRLDNRGEPELSVGLIVAVGKTFKSGYLNMPVNVYVSPRKDGTAVGLIFGFNTTKRPKI